MTRAIISALVAAMLCLQAAASFSVLAPLIGRGPHWLWPFLDYPMYSRAHYEGAAVDLPVVVGTLADGREVPVAPEDLGLNFWRFHYGVVEGIRAGHLEWVAMYAGLYRARQGRSLSRLRLESRPRILTRDGVRPGRPAVLAEIVLPGGPR